MDNSKQPLSFEIAPHVTETGQAALKLSFGQTHPVFYLDALQARALASDLIALAYRIDVKSCLQQALVLSQH